MRRFPGLALSTAAIPVLLLSVRHEVKMTSFACAPINSATCSRAVSFDGGGFNSILRCCCCDDETSLSVVASLCRSGLVLGYAAVG